MYKDYSSLIVQVLAEIAVISSKKYRIWIGGYESFYYRIVTNTVNSYSLKQSIKRHERRQESET